MRRLLLLCIFIALIGFVSAEWVERLRVQAVDYNMNPISDVSVTVNYQKNLAAGKDGTASGKTNEKGICELDLRNFVPSYLEGETKEYTITVVAPYGLGGDTRKTKYGDNRLEGVHLEQFLFNTTAARLTIRVKDQQGVPVPDAAVTITGLSHLTDEEGITKFSMPVSIYGILVSKDGFTATESIDFKEDMTVDLQLLIYDNTLKVTVVDEYGVVVVGAELFFEGVDLETNKSGEATFTGIKVSKGTLIARYEGLERSTDIEFYDEVFSKTIVFPSSPLSIEDIVIETLSPHEDNCTIALSCRAKDERVALSKIVVNLIYSKNGGEWNSISQQSELGIFGFTVPCEAPLEFSYMFTASNEYGSMETAVYNMSLKKPAECDEGDIKTCITSDGCPGKRTCVSGAWGSCADVLDDGCPLIIIDGQNNSNSTDFFSSLFTISLPKGLDVALVALILLGSLVLIGALGILAMTQRDKLEGLIYGLKNTAQAVRSLNKTLDKADKEYKREEVSKEYVKEGKPDDFFGLDDK
ncbi:MAG: carboxypeptidase-like regulatory domain-containing protein [Candidatus Micrarchaeota archaeon]